MVPDRPSLTRRRLLGGVAALAAGGTVAVGAAEPTALPDPVTDQATKLYPTPPEVNSLWRPTVTEAHAREAVELLAEVVSRGERLWQRTDTDEDFLGAGGWLDDARGALRNGKYDEALFDASYGMQFAAEALGIARARLGEADLQRLAERASALLERTERVVDDIRPYPAADPERDLAWYYEIERQALFARHHATWDGMEAARDGADDGNGPDSDEYDPRRVGSITAGLFEAELHARSAERFRDYHAETFDASGPAHADHLRSVADSFRADIEAAPTREETYEEYVERDGDDYTPYEFAHSRLARWCFDTDYLFGWDRSEDLLAYRAVELSKGVAQRRAHDFAVGHLVVEEGDRGFDSGHALGERRRARATYRDVVGSDPSPLLTRQVRRAVEDLQVAKVGFAGSYRRPLWRERLEAYLYALVGRAKLREYPALHDTIVERE